MKNKHILIVIISLFVNIINAQIEKGNWMVGGSGFMQKFEVEFTSNNSTQKQSVTALQISPNIGYFVIDKFAVGALLPFNFNNPPGSDNNSRTFGISPFARLYFLHADKPVNFFAQASFDYSQGTIESNNSIKSISRGYGFKVGPAIYFNKSVALEITLNYNSSKNTDNIESVLYGVGMGLQIHLEKK